MRRFILLAIAASLAVTALSLPASASASTRGFNLGVSSGDVSQTSALVWAHARRKGSATVEVRRDLNFTRPCPLSHEALEQASHGQGNAFVGKRSARASNDNSVQARARGLRPGTTYNYQWCMSRGRFSAVGHLDTPPGQNARSGIRFAVAGDQDAQPRPGHTAPYWNKFQVLDRVRNENNKFNIFLGDTIYSDSEVPGINTDAWTVHQKWTKYSRNLAEPSFSRLRGATSFYGHWDDHEFINDFSRFENGVIADARRSGDKASSLPKNAQQLYRRGVRAFRDFTPINYNSDTGIYRNFRWGKNLEMFMPDERSFRSAKASAKHKCDNPDTNQPDLAPTAPQSPTRDLFAFLAPSLAQPVSQGCLNAINDPNRTMLGKHQLRVLERAVQNSDATFKVIINEVPIQQFYALPYDRWEGYAHERLQLIRFLRDHVKNAVFLTTDEHSNFVNDVRLKTLEPGGPRNSGITEVTNGPVATKSFEKEINDATGNPNGGAAVYGAFLKPQPPQGVGMACAAQDVFSYAEVHVTRDKLTVRLKDINGHRVHEGTNGSGPACSRVVINAAP